MTGNPPGPQASPGFLLWRTTLRWQRLMTATLKPLGLTHVQFVVLATVWWLGKHDTNDAHSPHGGPSQRQVADHAATDIMMTSQVLRTLEQRGLITRHLDPGDSRVRRLAITQEGTALVTKAIYLVEAADSDFFVPVHDVGLLLDTLRQLGGDG
jgi:DNA-binding MarR family transcriptional regulator